MPARAPRSTRSSRSRARTATSSSIASAICRAASPRHAPTASDSPAPQVAPRICCSHRIRRPRGEPKMSFDDESEKDQDLLPVTDDVAEEGDVEEGDELSDDGIEG